MTAAASGRSAARSSMAPPSESSTLMTTLLVAVIRTTRLGWQVKIEVKLPSARTLTVHYDKDQADAIGVRPGDQVLITLRGAKVFAHGPAPALGSTVAAS